MNVNYEVQPQNRNGLEGELILAKVDDKVVGKTGYMQLNQYGYAYNCLNNALMKMIQYSPPDIVVDKPMRGNGIGLSLLDKLLDQLITKSFDMLVINQPDQGKKFYCQAFRKLIEKGKITSVHYNFAFKLGPVYEVRI